MGKFNLLINNQNFDEAIKYVDALSMDVCKELQKLWFPVQSPSNRRNTALKNQAVIFL